LPAPIVIARLDRTIQYAEAFRFILRRLWNTGSPAYRGYKIYLRPHPEELAKQASRRMDTTHGLAAILRDARKGALLRMRPEIYFTTGSAGDDG
jgi:hypothetical protein